MGSCTLLVLFKRTRIEQTKTYSDEYACSASSSYLLRPDGPVTCKPLGSGGMPPGPRTSLANPTLRSNANASPFAPSSCAATNCFEPASQISSCFGAAALPTSNRATASAWVTVERRGY